MTLFFFSLLSFNPPPFYQFTEYDPKKVLKELKKLFACNGTLVHEEEHGDIIQLQGDQRQKAAAFLVEEMQIAKGEVKVHG